MSLRVLDRHRRTGQVRGFGSTEQRAVTIIFGGRSVALFLLGRVPQTFENFAGHSARGAKIDFPARIAQTRSARNDPRRIANGIQMSHSLQ
jgi:hypothetical protein